MSNWCSAFTSFLQIQEADKNTSNNIHCKCCSLAATKNVILVWTIKATDYVCNSNFEQIQFWAILLRLHFAFGIWSSYTASIKQLSAKTSSWTFKINRYHSKSYNIQSNPVILNSFKWVFIMVTWVSI